MARFAFRPRGACQIRGSCIFPLPSTVGLLELRWEEDAVVYHATIDDDGDDDDDDDDDDGAKSSNKGS